ASPAVSSAPTADITARSGGRSRPSSGGIVVRAGARADVSAAAPPTRPRFPETGSEAVWPPPRPPGQQPTGTPERAPAGGGASPPHGAGPAPPAAGRKG